MLKIPPAYVGPCGCRLQDNAYRTRQEWYKDGYWTKRNERAVGMYNGLPHFCRCQVQPKSQRMPGLQITDEMYHERTHRIETYRRNKAGTSGRFA